MWHYKRRKACKPKEHDGGDDGWNDGFEDGFEDGSALGEDLFCFNGFEGIDEGSDDSIEDGSTFESELVFEDDSTLGSEVRLAPS